MAKTEAREIKPRYDPLEDPEVAGRLSDFYDMSGSFDPYTRLQTENLAIDPRCLRQDISTALE